MLTGRQVNEIKENQHDKFLKRLISGGVRRFSVFQNETPRTIASYKEPSFCMTGILQKNEPSFNGNDIICTPDLIVVAREPYHFLVVEAKTSGCPNALASMERELEKYKGYVLNHPERLLQFLTSTGLTENEAGRMEIGLIGAVQTKRGFREAYHEPLF